MGKVSVVVKRVSVVWWCRGVERSEGSRCILLV